MREPKAERVALPARAQVPARVPVQTWFSLDELSAAFLLYHTLVWLLFFEDRVRALRKASAAESSVRMRLFHICAPKDIGSGAFLSSSGAAPGPDTSTSFSATAPMRRWWSSPT